LMLKRRDVLKYAAGGTAAGLLPMVLGTAQAQTPPLPAPPAEPPPPFDWSTVVDAARALSKRPFRAPSNDLPDPFNSLTYDQYVGIRNKPGTAVWASDNVGFAIEPLHRGFLFTTPVQVNLVEDGNVRRLEYRPGDFDFGNLKVPGDLKDLAFSGFRVLQKSDSATNEIAIFQGASFFRAIARSQNYGVTARGLAVRTADPKGEEFPTFRTFWIEKPSLATNALVIYAVLESDSITGAYRFTFRGGDATISDTECTLFPRVNIDNVGLGCMTATYVSGPLDRRRADDVRPNVFDVNGLQMLNGRNEWLWRPVSNRETLQISAFQDENPHGFGFLQRDRDFGRYLDDEHHWELRPSLWIEPIGDWGPGSINLVEIPSDSEVNQNVIAYWRPKNGFAAGAEVSFAYRQFWCWSPPDRPSLATVSVSRAGRAPGGGNNARRRRFLVEFSGDKLAEIQNNQDISANLWVGPGTILNSRSFMSPDRKAYRALFDVEAGSEPLMEMRLQLEVQGKPISETWLYRWTA
jgi:glucans biosynthesis protein